MFAFSEKINVRLFKRSNSLDSRFPFFVAEEKEMNREDIEFVFILQRRHTNGSDVFFTRVNGVSEKGASLDFFELDGSNIKWINSTGLTFI